jgi:hypothetical protein
MADYIRELFLRVFLLDEQQLAQSAVRFLPSAVLECALAQRISRLGISMAFMFVHTLHGAQRIGKGRIPFPCRATEEFL